MKFTVNTLALQKALVPFNELEFPRDGKGIDSMIKLSLNSGSLTLSMNLKDNISMKSTLKVDNSENGTVFVFYNTLWSYLGTVESENVSLELKENNVLVISSNNKNFEITNISESHDIKTIEVEDKDPTFELSGNDFIHMIRQTIRCTSDNRMRPFMNGVYFHKNNDKLEAVATTGQIIAVNSVSCDKDFEPVIIKKESLYISQKYLLKDDKVKVYTDEKNSVIAFGNICIQQDHLGGTFPAFEKLFNTTYENKTVVSKSDLDEVLRIFANITTGIDFPEMEISIENSKMIMSCESTKTEIACSPNSVSYNTVFGVRLMLDIVSLLDAEEVELNYTDDNLKALEIRIKNSDSFKALIMPINK